MKIQASSRQVPRKQGFRLAKNLIITIYLSMGKLEFNLPT